MKIIIKPSRDIKYYNDSDGFVLPLKDFSVDYNDYYDIAEISDICNKTKKEIFVVINKMIENSDIDDLKDILIKLDQMNISGVFFYDLAILQLTKKLNLSLDLVLNNTHMVTNYYTCNYYKKLGVDTFYLSNELKKDEILNIINRVDGKTMYMMLGYPTVAFSKRKLLSNCKFDDKIVIKEEKSRQQYLLSENNLGTSFKLNKIVNHGVIIDDLLNSKLDYLYLIEDEIDHELFMKGFSLTKSVIDLKIDTNMYKKEMRKLFGGDSGFLFRNTIYKVKK